MKKATEFNTQNQGDEIYLVTVTETLTRTYKVRAEDLDEAEALAEDEYRKGNVFLDSAEYLDDIEFSAREHTDEDLSLYPEL